MTDKSKFLPLLSMIETPQDRMMLSKALAGLPLYDDWFERVLIEARQHRGILTDEERRWRAVEQQHDRVEREADEADVEEFRRLFTGA